MSAQSLDPVIRASIPGVSFLLDSASTYKSAQGVKWITATKFIEPISGAAANDDGPLFVGQIQGTFPPEGEPGGPNEPFARDSMVICTGIARFKGKSGQTFLPGATVVFDETAGGQDGQTVRLQGGDAAANVIGIGAFYIDAAGIASPQGYALDIWIAPQLLRGGLVAGVVLI